MTFPDGTVVDDEVQLGEPVETPIHGRTGVGHVVVGPWAEALCAVRRRGIAVVRCDRPGGTRAGNADQHSSRTARSTRARATCRGRAASDPAGSGC